MRLSVEGWLERSPAIPSRDKAGANMRALACRTSRKSWSGMRYMSLLILARAEASYMGAPVTIAPPRSAAYSR